MLTTTQRQYRAKDNARYSAMAETGDMEVARASGRLAAKAARAAGGNADDARRAYRKAHRRALKASCDNDIVKSRMRLGWRSERGF